MPREPRYRFPNVFRFEAPFDASTVDDVADDGARAPRGSKGGGRNRQTATFIAHRTVDAAGVETWSGTFKTRVVLSRSGKRLDTCELKRVTVVTAVDDRALRVLRVPLVPDPPALGWSA